MSATCHSLHPRISGALLCALALAACHRGAGIPAAPAPRQVGVGYQTEPGTQVGGSVESKSASDLAGHRSKDLMELIDGRFRGVQVFRTASGGSLISIRGSAMFSPYEQPLYVLDGVPMEVGRGLDWLSPDDIARIEVLKNVAETAIYGGRGANGVILITTRLTR